MTTIDPEALAFQPDAIALEARPIPWAARGTIYILVLLVAVAFLWASLAHIDRIVTAPGKIVTVDPLIVVQPLEIGTIHSIDVSVGQTVKAGTVLATLDRTFTESAQQANRENLNNLLAESARIQAELSGQPFPPANTSIEPRYLKLQTELYQDRKRDYEASVAKYDSDIRKIQASMATNAAAQAGFRQRLELLSEIEAMRVELSDMRVGSRLNLLQSRLDRMAMSDQLAERVNQEKELTQQLASAREDREHYIYNWRKEAGDRLAAVLQQAATATQQLTQAERRQSLITLRAPADSIVLEVAQRSVGSVVKEAEQLVTLVPQTSKLEAEVEVDAADIARLRPGDPVRVKLESLPYQRHGTLSGTLRIITDNSFQPEKGETRSPYYRARVTLDPPVLNDVPKDFRLIPGMTVVAEIAIGKRTVISYVLDPVIRLFDEGLREP